MRSFFHSINMGLMTLHTPTQRFPINPIQIINVLLSFSRKVNPSSYFILFKIFALSSILVKTYECILNGRSGQ